MSASFRSHFRHTPQPQDEPTKNARRQSSSQLPTKTTTSSTEPTKSTQHVSRLAKRTSKSLVRSEKGQEQAGASRTPQAPMTAGQHKVPIASRRNVVAPSSGSSSATHAALPKTRNHAPLAPPSSQTPSLVSGSSASTVDSPRSNRLGKRRTSDEQSARIQTGTPDLERHRALMGSRNEGGEKVFEDSILGITMPSTTAYNNSHVNPSSRPEPFPGQNSHYARYRTNTVTPPSTFGYASSTTPSTRYTDSPFSHVPTPSSVSSYSPSVIAPSSSTPQSQQSPAEERKAPVIGLPGKNVKQRVDLPSVRESSTSSSGSTVRQPDLKAAPVRKASAQQIPPPTSSALRQQHARKPLPPRKEAPPQATARTRPSGPAQRAPQQIPPELAHLNVDPPTRPSLDKALPPLRPSRAGTPSLHDLRDPSSVVQSDLPRVYNSYHKRTPSQEAAAATASPKPKSRFGFHSRSSSREASPRIDSAISPPPSARNFKRDPTPEPRHPERPRLLRKDSPAIGPAPSPSKSPRFGLFSRKTPKEFTKPPEKPKREKKRGPVAGTGHEGYGRFGFRGRSGSTATASTAGRSPSADSNGSSGSSRPMASRTPSNASNGRADLDDFLRERLNPVVLRGSGSTGVSTAASSSDQTTEQPSSTTTLDSFVKPQLLPSALRSNDRSASPLRRAGPSIGQRGDSSEQDAPAGQPTLAARRSFNRLQSDDKAPLRMPPPIRTNMPPRKSSLTSYDADESAVPQTDDSTLPAEDVRQSEPFGGREGLWLRSGTPKAKPSPKPASKSNFFDRAHSSPRDKQKENSVVMSDREWHAAYHAARSAGRYPMMESVEPVGLEEVERMLKENETSDETSSMEIDTRPRMIPYESRHSSLLPSPPKRYHERKVDTIAKQSPPRILVAQDSQESPELLRALMATSREVPNVVDIPRSPDPSVADDFDLPQHMIPEMSQDYQLPRVIQAVHTPELQQGTGSPKQPRLSPVGRIPMVVSRRDRDRKLSDRSFSRPFARDQPKPSVKPPGSLYSSIRDLASPIENTSQPVSSTSGRSDAPSAEPKSSINTDRPSISTNRTSAEMHEFFTFPRKGSEQSYSSSSGSSNYYAMYAQTAQPQHEDVWHEYNDLLDDVNMQKTPISAGSSLGAPFQYSNMLTDASTPSVPETPQFYAHQPWGMPMSELPPPQRASTVPAVLSVPQQIARFLQPSMSPLATPNALADLVSDYGSSSSQRLSVTKRASMQDPRASMSSSRYSAHSRTSSLPDSSARNPVQNLPSTTQRRKSQLEGIAEHDPRDRGSPHANLRYGALMTSKWLSFGRVLFSPAHHEMRLSDEPRILIIDGLGDDWSSYVAFSYPAATVYNLGSAAANTTNSATRPPLNWKNLPNLRHIRHPHLGAPFPFPKGFFTAVVLRFPLATTDPAYHACIFECKRVLRPGGHLEATVLDIDLVNMGPRARRAVQGLKVRMQQRDENTSLRNLSDGLVRLIGRRGFEDVQRCVVGIPAAGRIPRSQDWGSQSSDSEGRRVVQGWEREGGRDAEFTFADLLDDGLQSAFGSGKSDDEGITKMVAKVGRWWYSSCYESALASGVASGNVETIWSDRGMLRECEKQGTSFRLLICCAQKPMQTRRRTVSV